MKPYLERAKQIVQDSDVAVMVLLGHGNADMEFWSVWPRETRLTSQEEFTARRLRPVGVFGLLPGFIAVGEFKESLDGQTMHALSTAFKEYVRVLWGMDAAKQAEMERAELRRLWNLEDTRPN